MSAELCGIRIQNEPVGCGQGDAEPEFDPAGAGRRAIALQRHTAGAEGVVGVVTGVVGPAPPEEPDEVALNVLVTVTERAVLMTVTPSVGSPLVSLNATALAPPRPKARSIARVS